MRRSLSDAFGRVPVRIRGRDGLEVRVFHDPRLRRHGVPGLSYARRVSVGFSFQSAWFLVFPAGFGRPCMAGRCRRFDRRQGFSILSAAYGRLCGTVLRACGYAARSLPEKRSSVPSEHRKNCRFAFRAADPLPSRAARVFCPDGKTGIGFRNQVIVYFNVPCMFVSGFL